VTTNQSRSNRRVRSIDKNRISLDAFFGDHSDSRAIFDAVRRAVDDVGQTEIRVTKSQIAFRRRTGFAQVWRPGMYLARSTVPLVLTIGLRQRDASARWKEVVEPAPGHFVHHLELLTPADVDDEVRAWLKEAWQAAA
jgi:hypothetical protein